jgi:glycosyltransferase involved in cell wall biosynthesis
MRGRIHLVCNGIFGPNLAGGDIHFLKVAEALGQSGYELHYFGGHALKEVIQTRGLPGSITLTDDGAMRGVNQGALGGQWTMFKDFHGRYRRTLRLLQEMAPEDCAYATSDYWFDALPLVRCRARRKLMVVHLEAPSLLQIVQRSRPDVDAKRLASLHLWMSQNLALRRFQSCSNKRLLYVHPSMKAGFLSKGYRAEELVFTSEGVDVAVAERVPEQKKQFDVIWIGRVHRQKGIEDLLATLAYLGRKVRDFRAVLVGQLEGALRPQIEALGLTNQVTFAGLVRDDAEKFRLFKTSRVFLMPSSYESWGIVVGEALVSGVPVVAYDIDAYRPIFGDLVHYVPPFDLQAFQEAALDEVSRAREGRPTLEGAALSEFKQEHSWQATCRRFQEALESLQDDQAR